MDRMPPASARYTYARARTCDHTNPIHAPGSLRMCGWRAHRGEKKERGLAWKRRKARDEEEEEEEQEPGEK